jgi:hypothetical protein
MKQKYKTITLNCKSQERINQSSEDSVNNTANCKFALTPAISIVDEGARVCLKSACIPITFKNVNSTNDRFVIKINPATSTADGDCVFVTVQLKHGQYDSITEFNTMLNSVLLKLESAVDGDLDSTTGDVAPTYYETGTTVPTDAYLDKSSGSGQVLSSSVSTDAESKNHLKLTLHANAIFASVNVHTADGGTVGATTLSGGIQILFHVPEGLGNDSINPIVNREAHTEMGFGREQVIGQSAFPTTPVAVSTSRVLTSPTVMSVLYTRYIFIKCSLVSDTYDTRNKKTVRTGIIGKMKLDVSAYGSLLYYDADDRSAEFSLQPQDISEIDFVLCDDRGNELDMLEVEWSAELMFKGYFLN